MSTQTLCMDNILSENEMMIDPLAINIEWGSCDFSNFTSDASQSFTTTSKILKDTRGEEFDPSYFADVMSTSSYLHPLMQDQNLSPETTIDPTNMWQSQPRSRGRVDSRVSTELSFNTDNYEKPKPKPKASQSPTESDSSLRARHAANQRHAKVEKALRDSQKSNSSGTATDMKREHLREKNKVAAAKCRQRQRKQELSIQEKGDRLTKANASLKDNVQELRVQLNDLRVMALYHQECNCRVAQYNCTRAEKVAAEYSSTDAIDKGPMEVTPAKD